MKRAAIYCRVSTDRQAQEGDSISAQLSALRTYIDNRSDMICAGEYIDDGVSGTKYNERDELQRLINDVKLGKIDIIIFTRIDRWFRSIRHYLNMMETLDKYGVGWLAVWEPIYDTTTPQGRLIVNQMMSIAQFEAENTGQRIRQVFDYKTAQGEVTTGNCPLGYSISDKHLVPNGDADMVRDLFRHYDANNNLNELTRYASLRHGLVRTKHAFKYLLKNTKYIGTWRGNDHFCEPIVDRTVFDAVQRKLSANVKSGRKYDYIFSGMIRCPVCGKMYGSQMDRRRRKDGSLCETPRYRCASHYNEKRCPNAVTIREVEIEEYLLEHVRELLHDRDLEYRKQAKRAANAADQRRKAEEKLRRLKDLYLNGLISLDEYKADRERISAPVEVPVPKQAPIQLPSSFNKLYESFTNKEKRRMWQGVIKEMRITRDREIEVDFL